MKKNPTWRKGQYVRDEYGNKGVIEEVPQKGHRGAHFWVRDVATGSITFLKRSELRPYAPKAPKKNPGLFDAVGVNRYDVTLWGSSGPLKREGGLTRKNAETTARNWAGYYGVGTLAFVVPAGQPHAKPVLIVKGNPERRTNMGGTGGLGQGGFMDSDTRMALAGSMRGATLGASGYRVGGLGSEDAYFAEVERKAIEALREKRPRSNPKKGARPIDVKGRLFIGVFPTGIGYADTGREEHGDYKKLAFLPFSSLTLQFYPGAAAFKSAIQRHAKTIQAKRGQDYAVDSVGHTVLLGRKPAALW